MAPRFFRHGELPLVLLALLEREPMHGYQVLGELTRVFAGAYEPSAGSVYPAIRTLQQDGLVGASTDGRRSIYSLTDRGHQALRARGEELAALEVRTGVRLRVGDLGRRHDRPLRDARAAAGAAARCPRHRAAPQRDRDAALEALSRDPGTRPRSV